MGLQKIQCVNDYTADFWHNNILKKGTSLLQISSDLYKSYMDTELAVVCDFRVGVVELEEMLGGPLNL